MACCCYRCQCRSMTVRHHGCGFTAEETYEATDASYLNISAAEDCDDGCTGVTAVVQGRRVWIAHVGDSRAVLCTSSGAGSLSGTPPIAQQAEHSQHDASLSSSRRLSSFVLEVASQPHVCAGKKRAMMIVHDVLCSGGAERGPQAVTQRRARAHRRRRRRGHLGRHVARVGRACCVARVWRPPAQEVRDRAAGRAVRRGGEWRGVCGARERWAVGRCDKQGAL